MNKNLLIVFTRNPELGKVKTRLAKTIGNKLALSVYKHLLIHTENTIRNIDCDKVILYSEEVIKNDIWNNNIYHKKIQSGNHLGERMYNAFKEGFENNYNKIIIVGSDLLDLNPIYIEEAFSSLTNHDAVIGPAKDGGYYLLGMNAMYKKAFNNKAWGTDSVLQETLFDLKNLNIHLLKELNDIDTYEDLIKFPELKQLIND